ncbi:MAG: replication-associated recombination protein A [Chlamydiales bacterium]
MLYECLTAANPNLFVEAKLNFMSVPLAERLRPLSLEEVVGQEHLIGKEGFLTQILNQKRPLSIIFWGPPGSGKTTLAKLYAKALCFRFVSFSAVFSGIAELKKVVRDTRSSPLFNRHTLLFVDEIHRFNKSQQDAFLPYLEDGTFALIGATTENPSFSLNNALLSRVRVLELHPLEKAALKSLIERYEKNIAPLPLQPEAKDLLIENAHGDGRYLFNLIENIESIAPQKPLSVQALLPILQRRAALFDKQGEGHYNLISALHKSVRGSDPDAALYWLARLFEGGEDPLYIARRLIRMAVEDIGLADPEALKLVMAARDAYHLLGSPEGELAIAEGVVYLSLAPKSNALYTAYQTSRRSASRTNHLSPPKIILNAPTELMRQLKYGEGYQYDHDTKEGFSGQNYFPDEFERQTFYQPVERGYERELCKRLKYFQALREKKS